ncbi:hypothetical protein [Acuticoccus sediminis]|uniref:hypothetical protein n=1 Tax=Acuticoccus sediminis TaxID=2184697 RepID=UPI001CFD89D9|nr:hypothetical protein [Acuticoccus sediminis]
MPDRISSIVARLPEFEFELHRRCSHDPDFRAVCADYEEAAAARRHWETVPGGELRAAEYLHFLAELESEIRSHLGPV